MLRAGGRPPELLEVWLARPDVNDVYDIITHMYVTILCIYAYVCIYIYIYIYTHTYIHITRVGPRVHVRDMQHT